MPLDVAVASLVIALIVSVNDSHAALLYALVATQINTMDNWLVLTLSFFVYWLYKAVARAVRG